MWTSLQIWTQEQQQLMPGFLQVRQGQCSASTTAAMQSLLLTTTTRQSLGRLTTY
jgi:hypothetical protein